MLTYADIVSLVADGSLLGAGMGLLLAFIGIKIWALQSIFRIVADSN